MSGATRLLGGRVLLDQRAAGLRATIDPVLLAAAVPARAGEVVLEAGSGVGTASLCLLARVAGTRAVGVEQDPAQAEAAAENAAANGWAERFSSIAGDISGREAARAAAALGPYAHAMANPPWFSGGTVPEEHGRRAAKHVEMGDLGPWVRFLAARLPQGGTLSLVLPPSSLPEALARFEAAGIGSPSVFPLWPREGAAAKRVILSGRKAGRGAFRLLSGLVLHRPGGGFTDAAEAVLRHAAPLTMA